MSKLLHFEQIKEVLNENLTLKGKIATLEESLSSTELESKAGRETIQRLVNELDREQKTYLSNATHVEKLKLVRMASPLPVGPLSSWYSFSLQTWTKSLSSPKLWWISLNEKQYCWNVNIIVSEIAVALCHSKTSALEVMSMNVILLLMLAFAVSLLLTNLFPWNCFNIWT